VLENGTYSPPSSSTSLIAFQIMTSFQDSDLRCISCRHRRRERWGKQTDWGRERRGWEVNSFVGSFVCGARFSSQLSDSLPRYRKSIISMPSLQRRERMIKHLGYQGKRSRPRSGKVVNPRKSHLVKRYPDLKAPQNHNAVGLRLPSSADSRYLLIAKPRNILSRNL
jgi:hypothetical protein